MDVNAEIINGIQGTTAGGAAPAGNNVICMQGVASGVPLNVNCAQIGQNVAFLANSSQTTGGVYYATQPTINANCATWWSMTTRAAGIVATGADTFNTTINTGLPTGANAIGSIVGRTTWVSATPTISAALYASAQTIGGLMTFAVGGAGSGVLQSIRMTSKTKTTTAIALYLFDTNPTNSTWTDKIVAAIAAGDVPFVMGGFNLGVPSNGLGTHAIWYMTGIGYSFVASNLYGVLVNPTAVNTAPIFGSTSDLTVKLGIIDD